VNHRKNVNTIWKVSRRDGSVDSRFEDIVQVGVDYFWRICKEESRVTIAKVVKMTSFFPE